MKSLLQPFLQSYPLPAKTITQLISFTTQQVSTLFPHTPHSLIFREVLVYLIIEFLLKIWHKESKHLLITIRHMAQ